MIFSLGEKIYYRGTYETSVAGIEVIDGQQEFILIVVPNFLEKLFHPKDLETILRPQDYGGESQIDPRAEGQKGHWLDRSQFKLLERSKPAPVATKPDGCACIRCTKFCLMAENNLFKTEDLELNTARTNEGLKPNPVVQKAFGCFSCWDTEAWWFQAKGWTFSDKDK